MAPVVEATAKRLISSTAKSARYEGQFDQEWLVGTVPNGGYSLGTINVCVHHYLVSQLHSTHSDLFHISSTYLNASDSKQAWVVDLRVTKSGRGFTNLDAVLSQKSHKTGEMTERLQTRLIYTDFGKNQSDPTTEHLTIPPNSTFRAPFPCVSEPSECTVNQLEAFKKVNYRHRLAAYRDTRAQEAFTQRGLLHCAGYINFTREQVAEKDVAHFNNAAIIMFADMTEKSMAFLASESDLEANHWYPTMFLSIEMKRALPSFALLRSASYVVTRHVNHGQFELDVEIWSHPDDAQRLNLPPGTKSVILCISRQVALTIDITTQATITANRSNSAKL